MSITKILAKSRQAVPNGPCFHEFEADSGSYNALNCNTIDTKVHKCRKGQNEFKASDGTGAVVNARTGAAAAVSSSFSRSAVEMAVAMSTARRDWDGERGGTGRDGTGRDGTGRDGTGRDGTGRDGTGRDGTGRDGTGRDGTGRDGTGRDGTGRDGTGRDGTGRDGTGRDGTGRDGTGRDGTGRDGTGRDGTGRDESAMQT
ncbi:hypothetical protein B0H17DRAFT_1140174 [Mycena rosella]|uniref:Uncharacterized protein n=1 Tax=Mycena rosella TaxID=1033263 RepID=A0AAD7GAF7_MYCRO|nr:hypothetical protein B0H17DRAFT_1140174 [Mycena rosella]